LVGFYGENAVKKGLRKIALSEDPRMIITRGTKGKPFAIEQRDITVARLNTLTKLLKKKYPKIKYAKASPVREPRSKKIVTVEKKTSGKQKTGLKVPAGYGTYAVGNEVYLVPETFLKLRGNKSPKTYYLKWLRQAKKKGFFKTFKELGIPRTYKPTIYKGSGKYLPLKKGETLNQYYPRALRKANLTKEPQILITPKTVLGSKQPELEINVIYPNPKGVKTDVVRAVFR